MPKYSNFIVTAMISSTDSTRRKLPSDGIYAPYVLLATTPEREERITLAEMGAYLVVVVVLVAIIIIIIIIIVM
jgi:hypothetical protein